MRISIVPVQADPVDAEAADVAVYPWGIGVMVERSAPWNGHEPVRRIFPWSSILYYEEIGAGSGIIAVQGLPPGMVR